MIKNIIIRSNIKNQIKNNEIYKSPEIFFEKSENRVTKIDCGLNLKVEEVNENVFNSKKKLTEDKRGFFKSDGLISQFVNLIMKHGQKSKAENILNGTLFEIRSITKSDPYIVLEKAIKQCSPLMGVINYKKGNKTTLVPKPLTERQSRRIAMKNLLKESIKRDNFSFEKRLATEIIAANIGGSKAVSKKEEIHKVVLANKSNALFGQRK